MQLLSITRIATCSLLLGALLTLSSHSAFAASNEDEVRGFFTDFVKAQNAHDLKQIRAMLWDSPQMLWYARGGANWGPDAVVERLKDYYQGVWQLDPDMSRLRITQLNDSVAQILVPVTFTRSHAGEAPQKNTFLISQTLLRGADGWRVATIMPVADTNFK
ncbi:DUF3225 domain-containing protein [Pseudomonas gingeri NCPPB 3146 = LMG 5327]|uniref:Nuclear transport factor 2 family protein n=2 Tax=Pseudomonas gingeri TaxID=117681 RepID=A0A7Y8CBQ6_9PSED|nr:MULTISPECIES: nuclear transport factor 2 family protein [Pseudomonas]NVZ66670.1 nuclear transport factor 2 family protein [Pseudomonas gingeri]NVZ74759.1 nuclear transport factor 2 family protein [Pseudomonas gingeri]NWC12853.1 nuclear transport factor 2 family protein [Pseudomonas gingeri]NWE48671.1 nuclear transport factor 2 family protein [Pseudomonas gingeri]NWE72184.1 nuclear transport factor 2 family protein [Pseudomonas gingeri]